MSKAKWLMVAVVACVALAAVVAAAWAAGQAGGPKVGAQQSSNERPTVMTDSMSLVGWADQVSGGTFSAEAVSDVSMGGQMMSGELVIKQLQPNPGMLQFTWRVYYLGTDGTGTGHLRCKYYDEQFSQSFETLLFFKCEKGRHVTLQPVLLTPESWVPLFRPRISFVVTDASDDGIAIESLKVSFMSPK